MPMIVCHDDRCKYSRGRFPHDCQYKGFVIFKPCGKYSICRTFEAKIQHVQVELELDGSGD